MIVGAVGTEMGLQITMKLIGFSNRSQVEEFNHPRKSAAMIIMRSQ
jgi:hypothetical protein